MNTKKLLLIGLLLLSTGCGLSPGKPVVPKRMPETLPAGVPPAFDGSAMLHEVSTSGYAPIVTASRWEGKTYSLHFTVLAWMSDGRAVGLGGYDSTGAAYYFAATVSKDKRLGDIIQLTAKLKYYFPDKRDNVVWIFD